MSDWNKIFSSGFCRPRPTTYPIIKGIYIINLANCTTLTVIFQMSLDTGILPLDWKQANVAPIFKKGDCSKANNYRPVSLTCVACKLLEHIIHSHTMKYLDSHKILTTAQHGFRSGHSCETQLIQTVHDFAYSLNNKTQTDVVIMDFSILAFDTVPHNRLLLKCAQYGIDGKINAWLSAFLKNPMQRVVVGGDYICTQTGQRWSQGSHQGLSLAHYYFSYI